VKPDLTLIRGIKGFMDETEGMRLYELALDASRRGPCLEVGSYCGKSALYLGAGCRQNQSVLFSIDHHRGSEEQQPGEEYFDPDLFDPEAGKVDTFRSFRISLEAAGLEDTVVPMVCRSETAARRWATPLSLVFIDGSHAYEAALTDYRCWERHLMAGGYLVFHDVYEDPGRGGQAPYRVYMEAAASGRYEELPRVMSLGILKKLTG